MEYVQGETLKELLEKGPLPLKGTLEKATEIAEALEAAHRQNIVHRDLKPSNIMITPDGHVKVLDFGLAKRLTPVEGGESQEKTLSAILTRAGDTLGTLPYMSPEQSRGGEVDTRSDIFSFGVLLYEMITGVNPFKKDSPVDTGNAILTQNPAPLTRYVDDVPEALQHMVKKMLAKEANRRYQLVSRCQDGPRTGVLRNHPESKRRVCLGSRKERALASPRPGGCAPDSCVGWRVVVSRRYHRHSGGGRLDCSSSAR